jgi:thiol-disulfide isomerase/thioredoxin
MRKFLFLFFLLFAIAGLSGQSKIKVHLPGAENMLAYVWTYSDYISYTKTAIGTYNIDSKGNLEFTIYPGGLKPVYIQINFFHITFFVEKGKNYEVAVVPIDYSDLAYFPKSSITYLMPERKIIKPAKKDFNKGLTEVNRLFAEFTDSNYLALIRGFNTPLLVDSFTRVVNNFVDSFDNKNLRGYTDYQLAELGLLSHRLSNKMVVDSFFANGKLDLNNPYSMRFFNSYWSNYLMMKGTGYTPFQLDSVINRVRSYAALSALLGNDPLLQDSLLRELVIIRNIPQLYTNRRFNKKALEDILSDISGSKLSKAHQFIATNVRKQMLARNTGSPAFDFSFITTEGDTIKLKSFEGKYLYLNIWDTDCPECLAEMELTKELYQDFDDIIDFVSISVDGDTAFMRKYIEEREFQWTFAHIGTNFQFLYDYQVDILPRYILIDKNGRSEMWNAPAPSKHFSDIFLKMLNDKKGNLNLEQR